jgi:hypothetical protein
MPRRLALAALAAAPALAQEKGAERTRVGFGVSLSSGDFITSLMSGPSPVKVYLPIELGQFRVEPSLGFLTFSSSPDKTSVIDLGVGAFLVKRPAASFDYYFGGRLALGLVSEDQGGGVDGTGTDVRLAAALGAEWIAHPNLTIGAEVQAGYLSAAKISSGATVLRDSFSTFSSQGLVFIRAYP